MTAPFDPTIMPWPIWLAPRDLSIGARNAVVDGPQPLVGAAQSAQGPAGTWQMTLSGVPIHDPVAGAAAGSPAGIDRVALWRSMFYGIVAIGNPIYMPMWDWRRGPRARAGLALPPTASFSDGATFSDGSLFGQSSDDAAIATAAAASTNVIVVTPSTAAVAAPGDFISLGSRAYMIVQALPDATTPTNWDYTIWPPLRFAAGVGDPVEIGNPICKMVLSPKDRSYLLNMNYNRLGQATLTFYEANWTNGS